MRNERSAYRYPFTPYPRGWYRLARADEVKRGEARTISAMGRALSLGRDRDGNVSLHDGQAGLPIIERNRLLFGWFDDRGARPLFTVPNMPEHTSNEWLRPFALRWRIRVHIQETAENALDLSHFATVHTYLEQPTLHRFELDGERFSIDLEAARHLLGQRIVTKTQITYHGLGVVVASIKTPMVELAVLLTTTPLDQQHVELRMEVAIRKSGNVLRDLAMRAIMPREIASEFERDIPVWEAKAYHVRPMVCRAEGNILRIRRWAEQFYGETRGFGIGAG